MKCENCQAEVNPNSVVCPECNAPIPQNIEGFENAVEIQKILDQLVKENDPKVLSTINKLMALLKDYLPDYKKERRLLIYMINSGILRNMLKESDHNIAIIRARNSILNECFITESAAEFVLACFTYILGWAYESPLKVKDPSEAVEAQSNVEAEKKPEEAAPLNIEEKIFRKVDAFKYRLSRNVIVPEGYTKIEGFCFDRYSTMRVIDVPKTLLSIGEYAFSECKNLKTIALPNSLKIIEQGAFSQCAKLVVVKIPEGVLEIADNTFLCCQSLETVDVPATVTSVGANAFAGCEKLRKLLLHDSVKFIDDKAFEQCPELIVSCFENSYVHKYCISHNIKFEIVADEIESLS